MSFDQLVDPIAETAFLKAKTFVMKNVHNFSIEEIDSTGYNGQVGSTLIAIVTDEYKVVSVMVRIEKPNGLLIDEGTASLLPDGKRWMYVSTVANSNVAGTRICFIATNMPGNSITKRAVL